MLMNTNTENRENRKRLNTFNRKEKLRNTRKNTKNRKRLCECGISYLFMKRFYSSKLLDKKSCVLSRQPIRF